VADGPAKPPTDQPWHSLHQAALRVGDDDARSHAAAHRRPGAAVAHESQGLGRLLRAVTDRAWIEAAPSTSPLPRDVWLPSTEVLLARGTRGTSRGLTLVVKGGHNGEHHNHNDVGGVMVALHGVPVVVDAGRPTYTAQTFGPDRYGIWTMQSSWHNVPEIRGSAQSVGREFRARRVAAVVDDGHAQLQLDVAAAYARNDIRRWERTARLDRRTGRVTITEEWELDRDDEAPLTVVHLLLAGDVTLGTGRAVVTALEGAGTVVLAWDSGAASAVTEVRKLDDPRLSDVWGDRLTRLTIDVGDALAGTLTVTVEEQKS
jgi:hypothetical protein